MKQEYAQDGQDLQTIEIVQPGGSNKDDVVIETADKHGIAMVFTGKRHFKH